TIENPLSILELGIRYYYDKNLGRDMVLINDETKELDLTNTSSGLQSIIPLQTVIEYLIKDIYKQDIRVSVKEINAIERLSEIISANYKAAPGSDGVKPIPGSDIFYPYSKGWIFKSKKAMEEYFTIMGQFEDLQFTQLFLEEPELNIFPLAQRDLVYWLIHLIQTREEDSLFFTTHSPFILNALNNCLLGYLVKDTLEEEEKKELKSYKARINPEQVSVYEVTPGGTLRSIQSEQGTIAKHYFNRVTLEMTDEYYQMLEFLNTED
ncbi:MAG: ATP-binding protein, partial [Tannerellaceae bacterium]|nr:ATP-binding protein [Tannerellaceae bacterium]